MNGSVFLGIGIRCLELAGGEYVCIFHQDDMMLPDNIARKMAILHTDPGIGFVHSLAEQIMEAQAPSTLGDWMEQAQEDFVCDGQDYFRKLLLHGDCICAPTGGRPAESCARSRRI